MNTKLVDATKSMNPRSPVTASLGSIVGRGPAPSRLHEVFIEEKMGLLLYGEYCANLAKSQKRLDDLMLDEQYRPQIVRCEAKANQGKFRLRELLSIPVQRVLKYHLLLRVTFDSNYLEVFVLLMLILLLIIILNFNVNF